MEGTKKNFKVIYCRTDAGRQQAERLDDHYGKGFSDDLDMACTVARNEINRLNIHPKKFEMTNLEAYFPRYNMATSLFFNKSSGKLLSRVTSFKDGMIYYYEIENSAEIIEEGGDILVRGLLSGMHAYDEVLSKQWACELFLSKNKR